jgi:hypothetical protein
VSTGYRVMMLTLTLAGVAAGIALGTWAHAVLS